MAAFGEPELNLRGNFESEGCCDMAKGHDTPSYIHTEPALHAIQCALSGIRFIAENDINTSPLRDCPLSLLDELNKATYYLSKLENPSLLAPMFYNN
jgi:hypothetical protein